MEILNTILKLVFIVFPLYGGGGFFIWKVIQMEKARNEKYVHMMETIIKTCGDFQIWLVQNTRREVYE